MPRTTRRDLMSAAGFTALAGIAAVAIGKPDAQAADAPSPVLASGSLSPQAGENPDAELIGLCEQVIALEQQWGAETLRSGNWIPTDPRYKASQAEQDRLAALSEPLIDRIYGLPTHTLTGFRARARAIMASDYGQMHDASDYRGQLYSLMHDLAELG